MRPARYFFVIQLSNSRVIHILTYSLLFFYICILFFCFLLLPRSARHLNCYGGISPAENRPLYSRERTKYNKTAGI